MGGNGPCARGSVARVEVLRTAAAQTPSERASEQRSRRQRGRAGAQREREQPVRERIGGAHRVTGRPVGRRRQSPFPCSSFDPTLLARVWKHGGELEPDQGRRSDGRCWPRRRRVISWTPSRRRRRWRCAGW
jgi:hypothetical protein